jgi:hypothetical protein
MDIHKPKPVHGWKELVSEIGVVVIGISIALSAEAGIEALHWHEQVKAAHEALANDMSDALDMAAEREAYSACIDQHLNHLADVIDEAAKTGRLPPQGAMHRAPRRLWRLNSWDGLLAAGIAPHLQRDELGRVSLIAFYINLAEQAEVDENTQWTRLYTLVGPGRQVETGELNDLRSALTGARGDAKSLRLFAAQITRIIDGTHIVPADKAKQTETAYVKNPKRIRCLPDEPVPAHYGDGPPAGLPLDKPFRR